MADYKDMEEEVIYIPPNFKEGTSVMGFMIKPLYLIQAIPFIALIVLLIFGAGFFLPFTVKLVATLVLSALVIFIALIGINGDSLFGFLGNVFRTKKHPKVYLYNPRVKTEIKPLYLDPGSVNALPREKIIAFIEKLRKEKDIDEDDDDDADYFFREDIGIVEKPVKYMTAKEKKNYKATGKSAPTIASGKVTYRKKR